MLTIVVSYAIIFVDKNFLGRSKTPGISETPQEFIKKLLLFSPYSKGTIVKGYNLSFTMPQNGLGNILIIICIGNSDVSYPRCNNISIIISRVRQTGIYIQIIKVFQ